MPRGRRRGRRAKRNVRTTRRRSRSPKQQNAEDLTKPSNRRQAPGNNSLCKYSNNNKHPLPLPKLQVASVLNKANTNELSDQHEKTSIDLDDIKIETESNRAGKCLKCKPLASTQCSDSMKLCRCLARSSEDHYNIPAKSKHDAEHVLVPKTTNVSSNINNRVFPKYSIIKKKKTPYGKVKIYATGELEKAEEERIAREAIKLLKYVKSIEKQEKHTKECKTEQGGFAARIRHLFRK